MRIIVQRVSEASCCVDKNITGSINKGFLLFIGFKDDDTEEDSKKLLKKVIGLRVFEDEEGKMNKSLADVEGSILAISQFTLYADCKHGNRPSFTRSMRYDEANIRYKKFCDDLRSNNIVVEEGIFGADMKIKLLNDGPVTIILDSEYL